MIMLARYSSLKHCGALAIAIYNLGNSQWELLPDQQVSLLSPRSVSVDGIDSQPPKIIIVCYLVNSFQYALSNLQVDGSQRLLSTNTSNETLPCEACPHPEAFVWPCQSVDIVDTFRTYQLGLKHIYYPFEQRRRGVVSLHFVDNSQRLPNTVVVWHLLLCLLQLLQP